MEINNSNPSVNPSETPIQPQSVQPAAKNRIRILPVTLGIIVLLLIVAGGSYYLDLKNNENLESQRLVGSSIQSEEQNGYYADIAISFAGDVTKMQAEDLLKNLNLEVKTLFPLESKSQFREFGYPPTKLNGLFDYLKSKNLVDDCHITGEYPKENSVNAMCTFRDTVTRDTAVEAVSAYPEVRTYTDNSSKPIVFWPDQFFLTHITVSVPLGKEQEAVRKLKQYKEITQAEVIPLTQMPVVGQ